MQTLSSAKRTCMASSSAVEWTATVAMPSSLHARRTRSAISPRLAINIFSNIASVRLAPVLLASFNDHQGLTELNRLPVFEEDLRDGARTRRRNLVHRLHRLDDQKRGAGLHAAADLDKSLGARLRGAIGGPNHRRRYDAGMFGEIDDIGRHGRGSQRLGGSRGAI